MPVSHRPRPLAGPVGQLAARYWWVLAFLLLVGLIGAGAYIVAGLGHDTFVEGTTIAEVRGLTRLSVSVRDFEVPLKDQAAKLSWDVHYRLYRRILDSLRQSPKAVDIEGYLTGIDASVRRLSGFLDALLIARSSGGNAQAPEAAYRSEIDYAQEVVTGATDAFMYRLAGLAARVDRHWRQLLILNVVSSLTAIAFGIVLLLYRRDFLRRLRVESALRDSDDRVRLLLDSTSEGIYGVDLDGRCIFANSACIAALGYRDASELHGQDMHALIHASTGDGTQSPRETCPIHGVGPVPTPATELRLQRADSSSFPAECWPHQIERHGEVIGRVITFVDITQRRKVEAELRHSQRIDGLGRLAGGVAHDFNNLLTAIEGYASLAQAGVTHGSSVWNDLQEIRNTTHRAATLTRQLLAFGRRQTPERQVVDLNDLLARIQKMLRPLIGEAITIETQLADGLGAIFADPGQLEQVVVNLMVNARDAMPQGGRITVETRNVDLEDAYVVEHTGVAAGPYVMLAVSDTGVGIPEAVQARIFEPFFTTKEVGKGTGLGLATCYGIVKEHGGNIWCYSEPGLGATFKVYLPRTSGVAERAVTSPRESAAAGTETILLVEDEPRVRAIAMRTLAGRGYQVREAQDAAEALRVAQDLDGPLHLLITDVVMPGMNGIELSKRLRALRPTIQILYTSGYSEVAIPRDGLDGSPPFFLEKPFTPDALLRRVRTIFATPDAG
jgi:two-component system cell cycle sensor histidine kinase/response regulator CckA